MMNLLKRITYKRLLNLTFTRVNNTNTERVF